MSTRRFSTRRSARRPEESFPLRFFLDQNVAASVARMLQSEGHNVLLLKDVLPTNAPDPQVAAVAELNQAILVSHDKDFRALAGRAGVTRRRFHTLSRIALECPEPEASERLRLALSLVVFEWEYAQHQKDKRMIIVIGKNMIRTSR